MLYRAWQAVAENQPFKNRVKPKPHFPEFGSHLREVIGRARIGQLLEDEPFGSLAVQLFELQFNANAAYRAICQARGLTPETVPNWQHIPAVPTSAFKEFDVTCLDVSQRFTQFHSSGTTQQTPSRHFHNKESLTLYEDSLLQGFTLALEQLNWNPRACRFILLIPPPVEAPHSSLVHMFATIAQKFGGRAEFFGRLASYGGWTLDLPGVSDAMRLRTQEGLPLFIMGTAFSFVHLLDGLEGQGSFNLPEGSLLLETGGYKGRSRVMPRDELHLNLSERFGISRTQIICEYGMSELSSQAYALVPGPSSIDGSRSRVFRFPGWARARIISPETGREVEDGEKGMVRIFDLANVYSVMAVQTGDLGVRRGYGFELIGRAPMAEPRGCSLMNVG